MSLDTPQAEEAITRSHIRNCLCFRDKPPAMQHADGGDDPGCLMLQNRLRGIVYAMHRQGFVDGVNESAEMAAGWGCLDVNDVMDSFDSLVKAIRALKEPSDGR